MSVAITVDQCTDHCWNPVGAAARDILPAAIGVIPLAVLIGVQIGLSPIEPWIGWLAGPVIVGGSAHLAVLGAIGGGAVPAIALGLLVNARSLLYSAGLAPAFSQQPRWFRWLAPYVLVDQMYALASAQTHQDRWWQRRYYVTAMSILMAVYLTSITVGLALGPVIPVDSPLTLAIPIMFLTILVRGLKGVPDVAAALVAAATAWATSSFPAGTGLLLAVATGAMAGWMAEGREHD